MKRNVATPSRRSLPTIEELIKGFEIYNFTDGKSPKTIQWYSYILSSFLRYLKRELKTHYITDFTVSNVRSYILYLRHKNRFEGHPYTPTDDSAISPQTIRGHVRALKVFAAWLFREDYTNSNSLNDLKVPRAPVKLIEPLTPEEIRKIIDSIDRDSPIGYRNYAILITALDNGLRVSELAGITLGHINLKAGYIKVIGKGSKERVVPIGEVVKMTLWHYVNKVRPQPTGDAHRDRLFLSRSGEKITDNTIKLMFSRLAKNSGVGRLHGHLCRHTFAINYLLNGGDIFSLREILGHSCMEMVNHYVHFTTAQLAWQHHKFSPIDRLQGEDTEIAGADTEKIAHYKATAAARYRRKNSSKTSEVERTPHAPGRKFGDSIVS